MAVPRATGQPELAWSARYALVQRQVLSSRRTILAVVSAVQKLLRAALALPANEREELVRVLSISLTPATLSPEWQSELARRLDKIANGEATFHDAESHLRTLQAKHGA